MKQEVFKKDLPAFFQFHLHLLGKRQCKRVIVFETRGGGGGHKFQEVEKNQVGEWREERGREGGREEGEGEREREGGG